MATILYIEDEPAIAELVQRKLERLKHDVCWARNANDALQQALSRRPDLIILDIGLGPTSPDGWELQISLRGNATTENIPVIALTAQHPTLEDREKALKAGFFEHFPKPIDWEVLLPAIDAAIKREKIHQLASQGQDSINWTRCRDAIVQYLLLVRDICDAAVTSALPATYCSPLSNLRSAADDIVHCVGQWSFNGRSTIRSELPAIRGHFAKLHGYSEEIAETNERLHDRVRLVTDIVKCKIRSLFDEFMLINGETKFSVRQTGSGSHGGLIEPTPATILIVDDNDEIRNRYMEFLRKLGHRPISAGSGREAIRHLLVSPEHSQLVELILLDMDMPHLNGIAVLETIRALSDPTLKNIPIMLLAETEDDPLVLEAAQLGFVELLVKKIDYPHKLLQARINNLLAQYRLERKYRKLLMDVLPPSIVEEYVANGKVKPLARDKVAILFADIKGFSADSRTRSAHDTVSFLERIFHAWDDITDRFQVQKIKTVGDGYMAVAGLLDDKPTANPVQSCVECGARMILRLASDRDLNPAGWEIRVGIHVGPVVAGLLGQRQFLYDLWSSDVNKAARMEQFGRAGWLNFSDEAKAEVANIYQNWETTIEDNVKGFGHLTVHHLNPREVHSS